MQGDWRGLFWNGRAPVHCLIMLYNGTAIDVWGY